MRRTAVLMLVLSLFLGALAVYLARDWVEQQVASANKVESKQVNLTTIVVAKRPLYFGDELTSSTVEEVSWPVANVPPGSFHKVSEIIGKGERRVVLKTIQLNEPVLKSKISGFGGRATLSTVIDRGSRAFTIRVNDVNGVAGFVLPGDRVDILLTRPLGKSNERITDVLMQDIKVLGIDQDASEDKNKPKVARAVTLEVTPEQSQKLTLAQTVGQLALALRGATNTASVAHRRIYVRDLVDDRMVRDKAVSADTKASHEPKPAKAKAKKVIRVVPRNRRVSVRVYRGLKVKTQEVPSESVAKKRVGPKSAAAPRKLLRRNPLTATEPARPDDQKRKEAPGTSAPTPLVPDAKSTRGRLAPTASIPKGQETLVDFETPRPLVVDQSVGH